MQKVVLNCLPTKKRCIEMKDSFMRNHKNQNQQVKFLQTYQNPYCNYCLSLNSQIEASHSHIFTDCPLAQKINDRLLNLFTDIFEHLDFPPPPWFSTTLTNPPTNNTQGDIGLIPKNIVSLLPNTLIDFFSEPTLTPREWMLQQVHAHNFLKWKAHCYSTHNSINEQQNIDLDLLLNQFTHRYNIRFNGNWKIKEINTKKTQKKPPKELHFATDTDLIPLQ